MKTAERTIERPHVERPVASDTKRRSVITPIALVVAVVLGLLAGFLVWGLGDTDSTAPVAAGGSELTARQEQMIDLLDDYVAAWRIGDSEAAATMFTENGVFTWLGTEYRVDDGALANVVTSLPVPTLDVLEPVLVNDTGMLHFHTVTGMGTFSNVFEFTADGELLIISHEIID
jgi:hypothetical protein